MKYSISTKMTKTAISASLKKLMLKKPLGKITVREIIEDCEINRQTFYYHFKDIYDLVQWMFEEEAVELLRKSHNVLSWEEGVLLLFTYVKNNEHICRCALDSMGREHLQRMFYKDVEIQMRALVNELKSDLVVSQKYIVFISKFYTLSLVSYLVQWIREGLNESPQEVVELFKTTLQGNIKAALERASEQLLD